MTPPHRHERDDEDRERARLKIRSKAWRARCALGDHARRLKILILAWLGEPIETLMKVLQTLDESGKGLYDAVVEDMRNPFYRCKKYLATLALAGANGDLKALFEAFPQDKYCELKARMREVSMDFLAQACCGIVTLSEPGVYVEAVS